MTRDAARVSRRDATVCGSPSGIAPWGKDSGDVAPAAFDHRRRLGTWVLVPDEEASVLPEGASTAFGPTLLADSNILRFRGGAHERTRTSTGYPIRS